MRRVLPCLLVLLLPPAPVAAAEDRTRARCFPKGSVTLLENRVARVYREGPADDSPRFSIGACVFAKGRRIGLDSPIEGLYGHLPPALALNGTVLGFTATSCLEHCGTQVSAHDLARWPDDVINASGATLKKNKIVSVGSITVTRAGALAWITCPPRTRSERNPKCLEPGRNAGVYRAVDFGRPAERLATGRDIDPSSLRRKGSTISWIQGGERRTAVLKQPPS
jgi:hypothetical protein